MASLLLAQPASLPSTVYKVDTSTLPAASVQLGEVLFMRGGLVESLEYSPDGNMILTAGRDAMNSAKTSIRLWDARTGHEIRHLGPGAPNATSCAQFAGDRIVGMGEGGITFWDANGAVQDRIEAAGWQFTCSGDGRLLAWPAGDKGIQLYDVREHKPLRTFGAGGSAPRLSADGSKLLAIVTKRSDNSSSTGESLTVWDTATGKQLWSAPFEKAMAFQMKAEFSPDGKRVGLDVVADARAMGNKQSEIHVYDSTTGAEQLNVEGHPGFPLTVRFSPDRSTLAICGHTDVMLLDANTGKPLPNGLGRPLFAGGPMAFSPSGKTLALATRMSGIIFYDLAGGAAPKATPGLLAMAWAQDAQSLITIDTEGDATRWPAAGGKPLSRLATTRPVGAALSMGGGIAALSTADGPIAIYDTATAKQVARVSTTQPAVSLAVSPDGKRVAISRYQGLSLWEAATDKERPIPTAKESEGSRERGMMTSVFSDDLSTLACKALTMELAGAAARMAGTDEYEARAVDLATGATQTLTKVKRGGGRSLQGVGLSSGGELAAIGLNKGVAPMPQEGGVVDSGGLVIVIELATNTNLPELDSVAGTGSPGLRIDCTPMTFSRDGRSMAGFCGDAGIVLWDLASGKEYARQQSPRSRVFFMAFSPDGARLAAAGDDGTVSIWAVPAPPPIPAGKEDPWKRLAAAEAAKAYPASCELVASGDKTVAMLKERLKPIAATGDIPKRVRQLVADLDSDDFDTRDKANNELQSLGELAEPTLKDMLKATASDEAKSRIESLLASLTRGTVAAGDMVRSMRAVSVLGRIGTPAAVEALKALAAGEPTSRLTIAARLAAAKIATPAAK